LRIVLVVDEETYDPRDPDLSKHKPEQYVDAEFHVTVALKKMGHDVAIVPATKNLASTINAIMAAKPKLAFNLVEHVGGQRSNDAVVAALLEAEGIPFTGASASSLMSCRNKYLSKLIVNGAGVAVPKSFILNGRGASMSLPRIAFPMIVKPLNQDGSEGVEASSYVTNMSKLRRQVDRVTKKFKHQAICEEFIEGRELIVTLSGVDTISVDSIRELVFPRRARVRFATERVKFDQAYKKRNGIHYRLPTRLVASLNGNLEHMARKAYRALQIESYAKLEFRIRANEIVFIEANPNSNLSKLAKSTAFRSIGYEKFIRKVIRMAFNRHARLIASS
jgi:D-alanine-D-alanine ligase